MPDSVGIPGCNLYFSGSDTLTKPWPIGVSESQYLWFSSFGGAMSSSISANMTVFSGTVEVGNLYQTRGFGGLLTGGRERLRSLVFRLLDRSPKLTERRVGKMADQNAAQEDGQADEQD